MPGRNRKGALGDIDPARIDGADKPKRKRAPNPKLRDRAPMPQHVAQRGDGAAKRRDKRPATPGVMLEPDAEDGWTPVSPWADDERWNALLLDALGTRSQAVLSVFMSHLQGLCSQSFDRDTERWKPSELEWNAALAIVNAARPKNELEAMLIAQMVAIHWMQMKHTAYQLGRTSGWMEPKDAATSSMLARTFVQQMSEFRKARQKPRSIKQTITVIQRREVHHYDHSQHVHLEGGAGEIGGQGHEARDARTIGYESRAPLPGPDEGRNVVPVPRDEGKSSLPNPWRQKHGGT